MPVANLMEQFLLIPDPTQSHLQDYNLFYISSLHLERVCSWVVIISCICSSGSWYLNKSTKLNVRKIAVRKINNVVIDLLDYLTWADFLTLQFVVCSYRRMLHPMNHHHLLGILPQACAYQQPPLLFLWSVLPFFYGLLWFGGFSFTPCMFWCFCFCALGISVFSWTA